MRGREDLFVFCSSLSLLPVICKLLIAIAIVIDWEIRLPEQAAPRLRHSYDLTRIANIIFC